MWVCWSGSVMSSLFQYPPTHTYIYIYIYIYIHIYIYIYMYICKYVYAIL